MSDDLRKAVERLQSAMMDVRGDIQELQASQRLTVQQMQQTAQQMQQTVERTEKLNCTFEGFQVRVNEAMEMVVRHDTEQLQRVASVEQANDALRQEWADLRSRVEALEKKAG